MRAGGQAQGWDSSQVHEEQFCVSFIVTKQLFTSSPFSKIEVVENVKNVTLVPFSILGSQLEFFKPHEKHWEGLLGFQVTSQKSKLQNCECNVLYLIARWIWIKQLSKQDPSFLFQHGWPRSSMRTLTLIQNTADHYNFPLTKTKRKPINKKDKYTLIPRLVIRSNVKRTTISCKVQNVSSNFNLWEICKLWLTEPSKQCLSTFHINDEFSVT